MSIILLVIIIVLLLICITLLFLLLERNKKRKVVVNEVNKARIEIDNIDLPRKIKNMPHHILFQACTKIFDLFVTLDYASKSRKILNNFEWHSWQVSLLLALVQSDKSFFIPNSKKLFHKIILDKSVKVIDEDMQRILYKYEKNVNINKNRDELSKDIIWSPREVSIIFSYMINHKKI